MLKHDALSHSSFDGSSFSTRLARAGKRRPVRRDARLGAERLARDRQGPAEAVDALRPAPRGAHERQAAPRRRRPRVRLDAPGSAATRSPRTSARSLRGCSVRRRLASRIPAWVARRRAGGDLPARRPAVGRPRRPDLPDLAVRARGLRRLGQRLVRAAITTRRTRSCSRRWRRGRRRRSSARSARSATAWAFERIVGRATTGGARGRVVWFATATMVSLVTGRLTFALGLALAMLAVLALTRDRLVWCGIAGAAAALASPVAAAFLALRARRVGADDAPLRSRPPRCWRRRSRPRWRFACCSPRAARSRSRSARSGRRWPARCWSIAVLWRGAPPMLRLGLVFYALLLLVSGALSHADGRQRGAPRRGVRRPARGAAALAGPPPRCSRWSRCRSSTGRSPRRSTTSGARAATPSVHASYYDGMLAFLHGARAPRRPVPDRDPVHRQPLGVGARRADRPARPRLGAPAGPQGQRALLRRRPLTAGAATALAGRQRRPLRRAGRRAVDYSAAEEAALVRDGARRTCARSGTTRTGGSSRSAARRRWPTRRRARDADGRRPRST